MPFYIRKSISAGPFRLNFSKGGLGMSVGVKGLRLGTGPRGHYIHAGRGGLYYRSSLGHAGQKKATPPKVSSHSHNNFYEQQQVHMKEIESADVIHMTDSNVSEIISDINSKVDQTPLSKMFAWIGGIAGTLMLFIDAGIGLSMWGITVFAWVIGRWIDSYRRITAIYYDLEPDAAQTYQNLVKSFDELNLCDGKWHRAAIGQINTLTLQKRNAGATQLVDKNTTSLTYALPNVIASNITPPSCNAGRQTLYFFPDMILISDGKKFGAINYENVTASIAQSNFIEEGVVPSDAVILRYTWKHPNKNGGPDRRFSNNRQIPVCQYETLHLTSHNGLNEMFEFSRVGIAFSFSHALLNLARINSISPSMRTTTTQYA